LRKGKDSARRKSTQRFPVKKTNRVRKSRNAKQVPPGGQWHLAKWERGCGLREKKGGAAVFSGEKQNRVGERGKAREKV